MPFDHESFQQFKSELLPLLAEIGFEDYLIDETFESANDTLTKHTSSLLQKADTFQSAKQLADELIKEHTKDNLIFRFDNINAIASDEQAETIYNTLMRWKHVIVGEEQLEEKENNTTDPLAYEFDIPMMQLSFDYWHDQVYSQSDAIED